MIIFTSLDRSFKMSVYQLSFQVFVIQETLLLIFKILSQKFLRSISWRNNSLFAQQVLK